MTETPARVPVRGGSAVRYAVVSRAWNPSITVLALRSPLAIHGGRSVPSPEPAPDDDPVLEGAGLREREATLAEFEDYLRTTNSKNGRPFEEGTWRDHR
jgi:hypothetical protein